MARTKKKQPNLPPRRDPECRRSERVRYRTRRAAREGAPPPRDLSPPHRNTTNNTRDFRRISAPRGPRADRNTRPRPKRLEPEHPPTIKVEDLTPKPAVSRFPRAPILHLPFRAAPSPISGVQIRAETPSPLVKIETPLWRSVRSVRIEPPLGFLRSRAADSPMILRERAANEKSPLVATVNSKTTIAPGVQNASKTLAHLRRRNQQKAHSPLSLLASGPHQAHTGTIPLSRRSNQKTSQPPPESEDQERDVLQSKPLPEPASAIMTSRIQQSQPSVVTRLNLVEPVGPLRIIFPAKFVKYVLDTTFNFVDCEGTGAGAYQVTAYIKSTNSDTSELYCGTFSRLEKANEKVMQVFGRDPFQLMSARYADMVFKEADKPGQGNNEPDRENHQRRPWTAFGFDSTYPTLRIWAKDDEHDWGFRVEAVKV